MSGFVRISRCSLYLFLTLLLLTGCDLLPDMSSGSNSSTPNVAKGKTLNQWLPAGKGVEVRYETWKSEGQHEDTVVITRIQPHDVKMSIGYQPNDPLLIQQWLEKSNAHVLINGGYFDENNRATGLVVNNGQEHGSSYVNLGGMLSSDQNGNITVRSLINEPYTASEQLQEVTQSSPMLVVNGKRTSFDANAASSRRSIAAIDSEGRLLLIAIPNSVFSLDETADLLVASNLGIQNALNLDGGSSTGLYVKSDQENVIIDAYAALPLVIIIQ